MFLDVMSDNVTNAEKSSEILQGSQPNSSRVSSDSANSGDGTATNIGNVWPPLDTSVIDSGDLLNSNREQATSSNIKQWVENMSVGMTSGSVTPGLNTGADPLGSGFPVSSASKNSFVGTAVTPSGNQLGKRKTRKNVNLQNETVAISPHLGPITLRLERTVTSQHSGSGGIASPSSETEPIKKTMERKSLAQLK